MDIVLAAVSLFRRAVRSDGQTLGITGAARDARHEAGVDRALGFQTRSLLAVPVPPARGGLELINRRGGGGFERPEIELVERVGRAAADLLGRAEGKR